VPEGERSPGPHSARAQHSARPASRTFFRRPRVASTCVSSPSGCPRSYPAGKRSASRLRERWPHVHGFLLADEPPVSSTTLRPARSSTPCRKDSFLVANASYVAQQTATPAAEIVLLRASRDPAAVGMAARSVTVLWPACG
jgi:hypothetical protein